MRAHGFTVKMLAGIVRAGFAVAQLDIVKAGGRMLSMLRLTIFTSGSRRSAAHGASAPPRITDRSVCASPRCPVFPTALSIRPVMRDIAHQRAGNMRA